MLQKYSYSYISFKYIYIMFKSLKNEIMRVKAHRPYCPFSDSAFVSKSKLFPFHTTKSALPNAQNGALPPNTSHSIRTCECAPHCLQQQQRQQLPFACLHTRLVVHVYTNAARNVYTQKCMQASCNTVPGPRSHTEHRRCRKKTTTL